jgi:hypothetical protein
LIVILLRMLACAMMLALPFVLLAFGSGKSDGLLWLIFPVVLAVPAFALLALVFVPVEALAGSQNWSKNQAVLIAGAVGAALIWLSLVALQALSQGKPIRGALLSGVALKTTLIWILLGILLGCFWRASDWLVRSIGWVGHG